MAERFLQSLMTFVECLDLQDKSWTRQWMQEGKEYLKGHWLRQPGGNSWTLPKPIVAEIKHSGIRADDARVEELWNH